MELSHTSKEDKRSFLILGLGDPNSRWQRPRAKDPHGGLHREGCARADDGRGWKDTRYYCIAMQGNRRNKGETEDEDSRSRVVQTATCLGVGSKTLIRGVDATLFFETCSNDIINACMHESPNHPNTPYGH